MKKSLSFLVLVALSAHAQDKSCVDDQSKEGLLKAIKKDIQDDRLLKYSQNDKDEYKIIRLDSLPTKSTPTSVSYEFNNLKLKPGECAYLAVPEELRNKPVLFVNLGHTQADEDNTGYNKETKWDDNPGLTTVQLNQTNEKGESKWRYWNGMASGKYGAKFAEPFHMELEGLYEWYHNGHSDVKTDTKSLEPLMVDAMRLCSVGKDTVTIGSLALKVSPGIAKEYKEYNLGEGNKMGDSLTAKDREYGERKGSIILGYGAAASTLPEGWKKEGTSSVVIPLPVGKILKSLDVAAGDEKEDGSSGHANLDAMVRKKDGSYISLIKSENLPPQGVIIGSPDKKIVIEEGDELVLRAKSDQAMIMGLKIGLD
jgi:hypothetical protein